MFMSGGLLDRGDHEAVVEELRSSIQRNLLICLQKWSNRLSTVPKRKLEENFRWSRLSQEY